MSLIHLSPFDIIVMGVSLVLVAISPFKNQFQGVSVFLRVSLVVIKVIQFYLATHPHGKKISSTSKLDEKVEHIYKKDLMVYDGDNKLKSQEETGGAG